MADVKLFRCQIAIQDVNDAVIQVGNASYPPGTTVATLPTVNPQFWLDKDLNGRDILCTIRTNANNIAGQFINVPMGAYPSESIPTPTVDFIGPHPQHKPHWD